MPDRGFDIGNLEQGPVVAGRGPLEHAERGSPDAPDMLAALDDDASNGIQPGRISLRAQQRMAGQLFEKQPLEFMIAHGGQRQ